MAVMLALAIFGVIAIYSATYMREDPVAAEFWRKQANWVVVGFFAFIVTSLIDYRWVRWGALPMYLAGLAFLILTKFIGQKVYGARSWLHLAFSQPVQADASDASSDSVWRDRRRALFAHSDATGFGRVHHLGTGLDGAAFRRRNSAALSHLHHFNRGRFYSHRDQSWP